MFRRSKIKITPKIPQAKTNVDRGNEQPSSLQLPTESIDSSKLQQQQVQHLSDPLQSVFQSQNDSQTSSINQNQVDPSYMDPMPRNITSNQPPSISKPSVSLIISNHGDINHAASPGNGSHTPLPSSLSTPLSGTVDLIPSVNQTSDSQQNQGAQTRRINVSNIVRPQPPSTPPSCSLSSNSSGVGSTFTYVSSTSTGTSSRSRCQSFSKESLPPPLQPNSGINGIRGDSLDSEQQLTTTIVRDDSHNDPKRPRKRIKLTPEDLLDRNSITLYHLIHASITRTKKNDNKKPKEKKNDESTDENLETNSQVGSKGTTNPSEISRIDNDDTMDSIMTTASSSSTIIVGESEVEETRENETIGPRVKVGPDGQLIIDEESLVIKKPKPAETTTIEEVVTGKTTYASFRKRPPSARWSKAETIEFYTALNLIGPDFSLMSNLFFNGKRTRTDLKNKFRRENKLNKPVIEKALYEADVEYCLAREAVEATHS